MKTFLAKVSANCDCDIRRDCLLTEYCTINIGGPARFVLCPRSGKDLLTVLQLARYYDVAVKVIGRGSNLVFPDTGYGGVIVRVPPWPPEVEIAGRRLTATCGSSLQAICHLACAHGLGGIEHLVGVPGTLGGALAMNAGSMRRSISECLCYVDAFTIEGGAVRLSPEECGFGYRDSRFLHDPLVILGACFELPFGCGREIRREMLDILRSRRLKFPLKQPNFGSTFKSMPDVYRKYGAPGKIIEDVGLKGYACGGARFSTKHANFIVNEGGATCADVTALIRLAKTTARRMLGVELVPEVEFIQDAEVVGGMSSSPCKEPENVR